MKDLKIENEIIFYDGKEYPVGTSEAFNILSQYWIRSGWDNKYVYSFSWLGRPIIQLPEDMIRIQEIIFQLKPDVIVETGVAHGGSLIYYSTLFKALEKGRVIGIDIEIRPHNRKAIEEHSLSNYITLVEGDASSSSVFESVKSKIKPGEKVLVILDSCHYKDHVLKELNLYSQLVSKDSYIVVCDGIMKQVTGAPRTAPDWEYNNPLTAIDEFLSINKNFKIEEPKFPFNEGSITERVTYWPNCYLKKD